MNAPTGTSRRVRSVVVAVSVLAGCFALATLTSMPAEAVAPTVVSFQPESLVVTADPSPDQTPGYLRATFVIQHDPGVTVTGARWNNNGVPAGAYGGTGFTSRTMPGGSAWSNYSVVESGSARVADIACGCGWSSIAIARGFDGVTVDGIDSDEASIADARANADAAGVADRVSFSTEDAAGDIDGRYDLVCCFEALHDMAHPVDALQVMRRLAAPDGAVLIVDERAADALTPNDPDPMQRFFYAASVLHCLPVGLSEEHSAGTGTVMRTATMERYAAEAGFRTVEVLPVDHDMFRFYRLHP